MEAHLNVRTAVETLMKDGVTAESDNYHVDDFSNVTIKTKKDPEGKPYYRVTVKDNHTEPLVTVETYVRAVPEGGGA